MSDEEKKDLDAAGKEATVGEPAERKGKDALKDLEKQETTEETEKDKDVKPAEAPYRQRRPGGRWGRPEKVDSEYVERVVKINRVSKVVKGGKNFSFSALVVSGDGKGSVGVGFGKSNEVAEAIKKGVAKAKKNFFKVIMQGDTIPHEVIGKFKASRVLLKPAGPGTGVIAGGPIRAMCDAVGIKNILTKSLGSRNAINVVKATIDGFDQLQTKRKG
jgi:small subunit ribosomal protein S5